MINKVIEMRNNVFIRFFQIKFGIFYEWYIYGLIVIGFKIFIQYIFDLLVYLVSIWENVVDFFDFFYFDSLYKIFFNFQFW